MAEKILYESRPSGKVIAIWLLSRFLVYLFFTIIFAIFSRIITNDITPVLIVLVALGFAYLVFLWKTYEYKITSEGVYFTGGILVRKQKFVPFFKITNTEVTQNILEQLLGISKIGFQTAGTGGQPIPEVAFEGLEDAETPKQIVYKLIKGRKNSR